MSEVFRPFTNGRHPAQQQGLELKFGTTAAGKVAMTFSAPPPQQFAMSPEFAEMWGRKLLEEAARARGGIIAPPAGLIL